ncbi:hypothetical protein DsansV1_C18g0154011 [Dioscorea sansibarensis]
MKREGRLHGKVRAHAKLLQQFNPKFKLEEVANISGDPPVTGEHTRVISKPTNHSKYTGKCRKARCLECHSHPVTKSRDKAKGAYKLKSCNVLMNHKLVSWRIIAGNGNALKHSGISASEMLRQLLGYEREGEEDVVLHDDDDDGIDEDGDWEFCEFGFVLELLDGGDWCVVAQA